MSSVSQEHKKRSSTVRSQTLKVHNGPVSTERNIRTGRRCVTISGVDKRGDGAGHRMAKQKPAMSRRGGKQLLRNTGSKSAVQKHPRTASSTAAAGVPARRQEDPEKRGEGHGIRQTSTVVEDILFPSLRSVLWDRRSLAPEMLFRAEDYLPRLKLSRAMLATLHQRLRTATNEHLFVLRLRHSRAPLSFRRSQDSEQETEFIAHRSQHEVVDSNWEVEIDDLGFIEVTKQAFLTTESVETVFNNQAQHPAGRSDQLLYCVISPKKAAPRLATQRDSERFQKKDHTNLKSIKAFSRDQAPVSALDWKVIAKLLEHSSTSNVQPKPFHFLQLFASAVTLGDRLLMRVETYLPQVRLRCRLVRDLPILSTPLARKIYHLKFTGSETRPGETYFLSGLVTLNQSRKAVLLVEDDQLIYESNTPTVGVWMKSNLFLHEPVDRVFLKNHVRRLLQDPTVFNLCLRYVSNENLKDKVYPFGASKPTFLLLIYLNGPHSGKGAAIEATAAGASIPEGDVQYVFIEVEVDWISDVGPSVSRYECPIEMEISSSNSANSTSKRDAFCGGFSRDSTGSHEQNFETPYSSLVAELARFKQEVSIKQKSIDDVDGTARELFTKTEDLYMQKRLELGLEPYSAGIETLSHFHTSDRDLTEHVIPGGDGIAGSDLSPETKRPIIHLENPRPLVQHTPFIASPTHNLVNDDLPNDKVTEQDCSPAESDEKLEYKKLLREHQRQLLVLQSQMAHLKLLVSSHSQEKQSEKLGPRNSGLEDQVVKSSPRRELLQEAPSEIYLQGLAHAYSQDSADVSDSSSSTRSSLSKSSSAKRESEQPDEDSRNIGQKNEPACEKPTPSATDGLERRPGSPVIYHCQHETTANTEVLLRQCESPSRCKLEDSSIYIPTVNPVLKETTLSSSSSTEEQKSSSLVSIEGRCVPFRFLFSSCSCLDVSILNIPQIIVSSAFSYVASSSTEEGMPCFDSLVL